MTPRRHIFGVGVDPVGREEAVTRIINAARDRRSFGGTALAVHGLMVAARDPGFRSAVASLDLVTCDGQPVRWALNLLHHTALRSTLPGLALTLATCDAAAAEDVGVYLFGSTPATVQGVADHLASQLPTLRVVGVQADRFRDATPEEDAEDVRRIVASGAGIVLVGRGCPRQELWVAAHLGRVPAAMLAVGAAFDYVAGTLRPPPDVLQAVGLEWLYRLWQEPRRLWRRYLTTNVLYVAYLATDLLRRALRHRGDGVGRGDQHPPGQTENLDG